MNKILVTGGLGYIGSHTVVELIENGYEPIIIDNLSNSNLFILGQIEKIVGFIGKRDKLSVFGNDYNTPDGTCIRDYIHVSDLANAHVKCLEYMDDKYTSHEYFNIGTGNGYSILEVLDLFKSISGVDIDYTIENRRDGDIESIWADSTKSNTLLNWYPKFGIDDMVKSTWNWEKYLLKNIF